MKKIGLVVAGALCASAAFGDLADYVDPLVGTAGTGHTFPGACVPFGMVQASPDTGNRGWEHCSGYVYGSNSIAGFSQTHLNGTGCPDLGDVRLLPFVGTDVMESLPYRHEDEVAKPGFYSLKLDGGRVSVEVAAAEHSAIYRITYSGEGARRLLVDPQWGGRRFFEPRLGGMRCIGKEDGRSRIGPGQAMG